MWAACVPFNARASISLVPNTLSHCAVRVPADVVPGTSANAQNRIRGASATLTRAAYRDRLANCSALELLEQEHRVGAAEPERIRDGSVDTDLARGIRDVVQIALG